MGFMDKAKQLAEQAQEKLDDAQKQLNERQGGAAQPGGEGGPRYDKHGRPEDTEADAPPAASTPPPAADPAAGQEPPAEKPAAETPSGGTGGENATPDPFKPIE